MSKKTGKTDSREFLLYRTNPNLTGPGVEPKYLWADSNLARFTVWTKVTDPVILAIYEYSRPKIAQIKIST